MSPPASPAPSSSAAAASPTSPVPVAKAEDEDYVWDVFYQRPTKLSEWNAVANIGTLYVPSYRALLYVSNMFLYVAGLDYHLPRPTQMILTRTLNQKTKLTRTPMVSEPARYHIFDLSNSFTDEEYYKNDYPEDEEASSDGSGTQVHFQFHNGVLIARSRYVP